MSCDDAHRAGANLGPSFEYDLGTNYVKARQKRKNPQDAWKYALNEALGPQTLSAEDNKNLDKLKIVLESTYNSHISCEEHSQENAAGISTGGGDDSDSDESSCTSPTDGGGGGGGGGGDSKPDFTFSEVAIDRLLEINSELGVDFLPKAYSTYIMQRNFLDANHEAAWTQALNKILGAKEIPAQLNETLEQIKGEFGQVYTLNTANTTLYPHSRASSTYTNPDTWVNVAVGTTKIPWANEVAPGVLITGAGHFRPEHDRTGTVHETGKGILQAVLAEGPLFLVDCEHRREGRARLLPQVADDLKLTRSPRLEFFHLQMQKTDDDQLFYAYSDTGVIDSGHPEAAEAQLRDAITLSLHILDMQKSCPGMRVVFYCAEGVNRSLYMATIYGLVKEIQANPKPNFHFVDLMKHIFRYRLLNAFTSTSENLLQLLCALVNPQADIKTMQATFFRTQPSERFATPAVRLIALIQEQIAQAQAADVEVEEKEADGADAEIMAWLDPAIETHGQMQHPQHLDAIADSATADALPPQDPKMGVARAKYDEARKFTNTLIRKHAELEKQLLERSPKDPSATQPTPESWPLPPEPSDGAWVLKSEFLALKTLAETIMHKNEALQHKLSAGGGGAAASAAQQPAEANQEFIWDMTARPPRKQEQPVSAAPAAAAGDAAAASALTTYTDSNGKKYVPVFGVAAETQRQTAAAAAAITPQPQQAAGGGGAAVDEPKPPVDLDPESSAADEKLSRARDLHREAFDLYLKRIKKHYELTGKDPAGIKIRPQIADSLPEIVADIGEIIKKSNVLASENDKLQKRLAEQQQKSRQPTLTRAAQQQRRRSLSSSRHGIRTGRRSRSVSTSASKQTDSSTPLLTRSDDAPAEAAASQSTFWADFGTVVFLVLVPIVSVPMLAAKLCAIEREKKNSRTPGSSISQFMFGNPRWKKHPTQKPPAARDNTRGQRTRAPSTNIAAALRARPTGRFGDNPMVPEPGDEEPQTHNKQAPFVT